MNAIMEFLNPYSTIILNERSWSWTLIGIAYLIAAFIIRGWFLKPLVARAKECDRASWQAIKRIYLKHSIWGWVFFLIPLVIFVILWYRGLASGSIENAILLLGLAGACFFLSILIHLQVFGSAVISVLKQILAKEKGIDF